MKRFDADHKLTSIRRSRKRLDDDDDAGAGADASEEGLDDIDNETNFDSNPSTTMLSFAHSSISDFFRDPKQGKVTATDGEHPSVGFSLEEAHLTMAKTCLDILVDLSLLNRMKDAVSLHLYAANYWKEHLTEVDRKGIDEEERLNIGISIARMMQETPLLRYWVWSRGRTFFTSEAAKSLLNWMSDDNVLERLPQDSSTWIKSVLANTVELFEPAMKYISERWLVPAGYDYTATICVGIVFM